MANNDKRINAKRKRRKRYRLEDGIKSQMSRFPTYKSTKRSTKIVRIVGSHLVLSFVRIGKLTPPSRYFLIHIEGRCPSQLCLHLSTSAHPIGHITIEIKKSAREGKRSIDQDLQTPVLPIDLKGVPNECTLLHAKKRLITRRDASDDVLHLPSEKHLIVLEQKGFAGCN